METSSSRRSFEEIHDAFAFFIEHGTETEASRDAILHSLPLPAVAPIRWLDFGCGNGEFLAGILAAAEIPVDLLHLTLVDVDPGYLEAAAHAVARFAIKAPETAATADAFPGPFDVITSNHVLYYMPDLAKALRTLLDRLAPGGHAIFVLGGADNAICNLWQEFYSAIGEPVPFFLAEDLAGTLAELDVEFEEQPVKSICRFPDTRENRLKILRFAFADKLEMFGESALLAAMDRFSIRGEIILSNTDRLFVIRKAE